MHKPATELRSLSSADVDNNIVETLLATSLLAADWYFGFTAPPAET